MDRTRKTRRRAKAGAVLLSLGVVMACADTSTAVSVLGADPASLTITVADDVLQSSGTALVLEVGDSVALAVLATNALGLAVQSGVVTWSSSDTGVAQVSATGVLRGIAPGSADVLATADGVAARLSATVNDTVTVFPAPSR